MADETQTEQDSIEKNDQRHGVPEVANKSDYVEPGSWQAEVKEKALANEKPLPQGDKPKATPHNQLKSDEELQVEEAKLRGDYKETDIFAWANNIVQYKDELKVDLFLFNKNYVFSTENLFIYVMY